MSAGAADTTPGERAAIFPRWVKAGMLTTDVHASFALARLTETMLAPFYD